MDPKQPVAIRGAKVFRISVSLFGIVGLSLFLMGCVYLSLDEFMSYHAEALQIEWDDLQPNYRGLILGFLKGLGSGAFVVGFLILLMVAMSIIRDPRPFLVLLPSTAISYSVLLCYATYTVFTTTPSNPPLLLTVVLVVTSILASIGFVLSQRNDANE
jgi:uncharacterized membrane protein YfcA